MRRAAIVYLAVQAGLVAGWWALLGLSTSAREAFELDSGRRLVLDAFVAGDVAVLVVGSLVAAWLGRRGSPWAGTVAAMVAGASAYATLYLAWWVAGGGDGAGGLVPMTVMTAGSAGAAMVLRR